MGWPAFTASLVQSLAWPVGAVALGVILRRPLSDLLSRDLRRLRVGPFEAEWDQQAAEVRHDLRQGSPELPEVVPLSKPRLSEDLSGLAAASPPAAITTAYARIEARLVELLDEAGAPSYTAIGGEALALLARRHGLISEQALSSIDGLAVLRNLAVQGPVGNIDLERAREFLVLADAVLYTLRKSAS